MRLHKRLEYMFVSTVVYAAALVFLAVVEYERWERKNRWPSSR